MKLVSRILYEETEASYIEMVLGTKSSCRHYAQIRIYPLWAQNLGLSPAQQSGSWEVGRETFYVYRFFSDWLTFNKNFKRAPELGVSLADCSILEHNHRNQGPLAYKPNTAVRARGPPRFDWDSSSLLSGDRIYLFSSWVRWWERGTPPQNSLTSQDFLPTLSWACCWKFLQLWSWRNSSRLCELSTGRDMVSELGVEGSWWELWNKNSANLTCTNFPIILLNSIFHKIGVVSRRALFCIFLDLKK